MTAAVKSIFEWAFHFQQAIVLSGVSIDLDELRKILGNSWWKSIMELTLRQVLEFIETYALRSQVIHLHEEIPGSCSVSLSRTE